MENVPEIATVQSAADATTVAKPNPMPGLPGGVNPLDFLYKLAMQRNMKPPEFKQVTEQGPAHMKTFVWHCSFNEMVAQGTGRSKKEAKIAAAKCIRDSIDYEKLPPAPTYQNAVKRKANMNGHNALKRRRTGFNRFPPQFPPGGGFYGGFFPGFHNQTGFQSGGEELADNGDDPKAEDDAASDRSLAAAGPPARETFMHPRFGGFYDSSAALPFDHSNLYDRERSLLVGECQSRMARGYCSRLSKLDRHVIRKHKEIYPQDHELSSILSLVTRTEDNLKKVAENLNADGKKISGMVRIGDLSKGLLLSSDRKVDLVLLCKKWPNRGLLQEILDAFNSLETPGASATIEEEIITVKEDEFQVNVYLTSTSLDAKDEEGVKLSERNCEDALRELRRSRWFAVTAANLPSCVECVRVVKDLAIRDKAWSALSNWAIEVLVERSLFSAWMPLNPAASLMRVMEIVSSGVFLRDGSGLMDPCENNPKDVGENLMNQQREDLTLSAQVFLRFMHFRKIYKVLGLESDDLFDSDIHQNGEDKTAE